ncbi:hypothetical protein Dcar01_03836 [Deinococcus carri]|uniref:Uncharacterized protein n=1 Tax=Deinococcus carri TaxID=1211323 RepID=A0ABP9WCL2_9DEIO
MNWKDRVRQEQQLEERRAGQKKRKVTPFDLLALTPGDQVFYRPPTFDRPRSGSRAVVVRGPRQDVQSPSVRIRFPDGVEQTVPATQVGRAPHSGETPGYLLDARSRPSWPRLVALLREAAQLEADQAPGGPALRQEAEQRVRQLAGIVAPRGSEKAAKVDIARVLLEAATVEAAAAAARQAGRGGRGPVRHPHLPDPIQDVDVLRLNQEQRAMINNIAKCIHRRYFLSDAESRERVKIPGVLRQIVREAQREVGGTDAPAPTTGKGSELQGTLHDSLISAYQLSLEACQRLAAGDVQGAVTLAQKVQGHRAAYLQANAELERHRVKHHTGRYFHGDVLSVREEHEDGGMTQYYARLTIVYAEDGHSLTVANARELEALTATRVGAPGWASLCRWIEDQSERAGGRKQGRRQADDEHLIYQEHDDYLKLRPTLEKYPDLLRAFEAIRRALLLSERDKDIVRSEIPNKHPSPGWHAPATK